MSRWTVERVLATAPDDATRGAAKGLALPRRWSDLGSDESLVWGKCQGSGARPYQVSVDLRGPAFRCSCPSRKHPCKHAVGLLLLWAANDGTVGDAMEASAYATAWAAERAVTAGEPSRPDATSQPDATAEGRRSTVARGPVDPEAQKRRETQRSANIDDGLAELSIWITDQIRQGLAGARSRPFSAWDQVAARLVDTQAPGLAERVRALGSAVLVRSDWPEHLLVELGRLASVIRAWNVRHALGENAQADLRTVVGWARSSEEVRARGTIRGRWQVAGRTVAVGERLSTQRTWLWSPERDEWGVVLDFSVAVTALPLTHRTGAFIDAQIALYPGEPPRRALLVESSDAGDAGELCPARSLLDGLAAASAMLARNPWASRVPLAVKAVRVLPLSPPGAHPSRWGLSDADGRMIPIDAGTVPWPLLALAGEDPCSVFGEWDGRQLTPVSVAVDGAVTGW